MLSEQQCKLVETGLTEDVEPRKVAAYLCLHMGFTLSEVTGLKWKDIDLDAGVVTLCSIVSSSWALTPLEEPRTFPMPPHIVRYLTRHSGLYENRDCYILSGKKTLPPFHLMQNILTTVAMQQKLEGPLSASDLRQAFIRRCIQSGVDLYSLCAYIGIKQPNVIVKKYAEYFEPKLNCVDVLEQYSADYQPPQEPKPEPDHGPKRMNLLILGAGSQGPVVKEIAEAIGIFNEIDFLDDDPNNKLAIGILADHKQLACKYPLALPSFGSGELRKTWMESIEETDQIVPTLIHPSATVSPNASIGRGIVIEARSIISAGCMLDEGVLVSSAAVLEVGCHIYSYAHIGSAVTVSKMSEVQAYERVPAGTVIRNR